MIPIYFYFYGTTQACFCSLDCKQSVSTISLHYFSSIGIPCNTNCCCSNTTAIGPDRSHSHRICFLMLLVIKLNYCGKQWLHMFLFRFYFGMSVFNSPHTGFIKIFHWVESSVCYWKPSTVSEENNEKNCKGVKYAYKQIPLNTCVVRFSQTPHK